MDAEAVPALVFQKVLIVLIVAALGFLARRRGLLDARGTAGCSRIVVDVAFPCLVLTQLPRTADAASLAAAWPVPLVGFLLIGGGSLLGRLLTRSPTGAFLVGLPNWIFLPLLIAPALHGDAGLRTVLLVDAGAQVALWTLGVLTLSGRISPRGLLQPGLFATAMGLLLALLFPPAAWPLPIALFGEALGLLGQLAVPLSLFTMGAQLAEAGAGPVDWPELLRVLLGRMVLVPALAAGLLFTAGAGLSTEVRSVLLITAAMPVAVSGSLFAQRFGGDAALASRAVMASTMVALGTVPGLLWVLG